MIQPLVDYLCSNGYFPRDAVPMAEAFERGGIDAAVATFAWADDPEHDYTGELRDVFEQWVIERGGSTDATAKDRGHVT